MVLRAKTADVEFDVVSEHLTRCALNFIFVSEWFFWFSSSSWWSTKSVYLKRSGTCAPSNRFSMIRAEGVDQVFLLKFFRESLMLILADEREQAGQICSGEEFIFIVLARLLKYFCRDVKMGSIMISATFFFQRRIQCSKVRVWTRVNCP